VTHVQPGKTMTRMQATFRAAAVVVGVLHMSACWKRPTRASESRVSRVTVEVANHHWSTVVIYAVINAQNVRLGEVNTGERTTLTTPPGVDPGAADFRILVDPIGSGETYNTGPLHVLSGNRVLLTVENDIRNSTYRIM